jgi:hypothetical protein
MKPTNEPRITGKTHIADIIIHANADSRDIHGFDGPIKVSFGNYTYPVMQDFLRAAESQGIPTTDDLQDLVTGQYVVPPTEMFLLENANNPKWC